MKRTTIKAILFITMIVCILVALLLLGVGYKQNNTMMLSYATIFAALGSITSYTFLYRVK